MWQYFFSSAMMCWFFAVSPSIGARPWFTQPTNKTFFMGVDNPKFEGDFTLVPLALLLLVVFEP